jgi:putative DNA methylase
MVFTYQNLDGRGWEALADALALAGIRPPQGWPMFGDGGAGLHKHANSISWDCVLHCGLDPDRWQERLAEDGHALTPGDAANLRHAGRVLASFARSDVVDTPDCVSESVA